MRMFDVFEILLAAVSETNNECLDWVGTKSSSGYGNIRVEGKKVSVHRLAYLRRKGAIPDGYLVCHSCDNRLCFNPNHLFLGTSQDNVNDMMKKGRLNRANNRANSKLTQEDIDIIRAYDLSAITVIQIAKKHNIHRSTVYKCRV